MEKEEEAIEEILELTKDTNRKTRAMYRGYVLGSIWKTVYWILIIGVTIGSFYYLQPYLNLAKKTIELFSGQSSTSTSGFDFSRFRGL